jgi:hypothetical protein
MRKILTALIAAGSIALASMATSTSANAQWRGWGWGGVGVGLAAGAIIGSAIAANSYYNSGYYGYPAGDYYHPAYGYGHGYAPAYGYTTTTYAPSYNYGYTDTYAAHPYGYYSTHGYGAPVHPYVGYRVRHYTRRYVQHY